VIQSFLLAWRSLARGRVVFLLLLGVTLAHLFLPSFVRGDGTDAGFLETYVRTVSGGAAALVFSAVLCLACGMFARERDDKLLALAAVRPVGALGFAFGRFASLLALSALSFAASALFAFFPVSASARAAVRSSVCRHHVAPMLPSVEECAKLALKDYLADPKTPETVRRAPKSAVLSLLANKELDRYDVIRPDGEIAWPFSAESVSHVVHGPVSVRIRLATEFDLRSSVAGEFCFCGMSAVVTNATQSVFEVPLALGKTKVDAAPTLVFRNRGKRSVMARPRRDVELVAPADSFGANLFRAAVESVSLAAALAAFGLFLSATLSRPVATFVALVLLAVSLMAPSVAVQYPDELDAPLSDRFGLWTSHAVWWFTSAFADPTPISDLAEGRAVEWSRMAHTVLSNLVVIPALFLSLSALLFRRKAA